MSHTPGPWRVGSKSGYNMNTVFHEQPTRYEGEEGGICQVYNLPMHTTATELVALNKEGRYLEGIANARLIAAAPQLLEDRDKYKAQRDQLLEALEGITLVYMGPPDEYNERREIDYSWAPKVRAAIAAAKEGK